MNRYVALGSSMAAGPWIGPRAVGAPWRSGRSARNYPHLVAEALSLDLVDVTYSNATTTHVLTDKQHGAPPQVSVLDGTEALVTVTIGGNDTGYVPLLLAACLPRAAPRLPMIGRRAGDLLDPDVRGRALAKAAGSLTAVGHTLRERSPRARIMFVNYLTLLPPPGSPAAPLSQEHADLGRHVAATLEELTAQAAAATGCEIVNAAKASREHHAWSQDPWTARCTLPLRGRPAPFHPNVVGMRAVAELVTTQTTGPATP